jgi:hypothetical protein
MKSLSNRVNKFCDEGIREGYSFFFVTNFYQKKFSIDRYYTSAPNLRPLHQMFSFIKYINETKERK